MDHTRSDPELADVARRYLLKRWGQVGLPVRLVLHFASDLALDSVTAELGEPGGREDKVYINECMRDVIMLLAKSGHRLKTAKILDGLEKQGALHGDTTVKTTLARAVKLGILDNRSDAKPPGYGLPSWT